MFHVLTTVNPLCPTLYRHKDILCSMVYKEQKMEATISRGRRCPRWSILQSAKRINTSTPMERVHIIMCKRYIGLHLVYAYILYVYATEPHV